MPRLNGNVLNTWVTLVDPVPDGTPVVFSPERVKVGLGIASPSEQRAVVWPGIALRYHSQITFNTRLMLDDGRELIVQSIGNYGNVDRSGWMTLDCEEVLTP